MRVRFWGTRGSIATPGPGTVRYGGNTVCVEVRSDSGSLVVLDCGTGARLLGQQLVAAAHEEGTVANGCLLIGHTHWDHIQGLPFFAPLFEPHAEWHIYGPRGLNDSLAQTLSGQMQYQYFPVTVEQLSATVSFHDLLEGSFEVGDLRITTQYLNHPALTLGYRIEGDGVSVVYACDHEPFDPGLAPGGDVTSSPADARHAAFLAEADLVIHDAQYVVSEYEQKRGWGHSTIPYAIDAARAAGAGELALFHHDPSHDDDAVDRLLADARAYADSVGYQGVVTAAAEGTVLDIVPRATAAHTALVSSWNATYEPTLGDLAAPVVLAATDPALRQDVLAAAEAEHLAISDLSDDDGDGADSVLIIDHDDESTMARVLNQLGRSRAVLALTRGRPLGRPGEPVADWLVWPASIGHIRTKLRAAVLRQTCRWQNAPLPGDETERVRSLHALKVLDTPAEERFDRYTREACEILDVPVALVTLVDSDRQWFKSRQGVDVAETPRDQSVCAHAILEPDVLQVSDLSTDDRFADNPLLGASGLRFYAGVPLVLSDGSRVGTFCVGDHRPRKLDDDKLEQLRELAGSVQAELEVEPQSG